MKPIDNNKDVYDFEGSASQIYAEKCKRCGKEIKISTQQDMGPEYHTTIFVMCECGQSIKFILPVN